MEKNMCMKSIEEKPITSLGIFEEWRKEKYWGTPMAFQAAGLKKEKFIS